MTSLPKNRVASIDLLKGFVMVLMALDHTRDYFHAGAFLFDPADPTQTNIPIYLTRWVTHFCAPAFCFLAGISAFFVSKRRTKSELSAFLLKRGIWLVFIELTVVNFAWYFDIQFRTTGLLVIWSLGISMIVLAGLVHLPKKFILIFSLVFIFGHNLLDSIHFEGNVFWSLLHDRSVYPLGGEYNFYIDYPLIPWIAVMSLGYYAGGLYDKSFDPVKRKKILIKTGLAAIVFFFIIRGINVYGDPKPWIEYDSFTKTFMSFMNPTKYPPSLSYLLMTLGPVLLFLAYSEKIKGGIVKFFCTFGRVPFFYYILHLYLIHILALIAAEITGFGWENMVLADWVTEIPILKGYGFGLWVVYLAWFAVIGLLYPLCVKFDKYKMSNKRNEWLSYL